MATIEDYPLWLDCPFRDRIPSWVQEIRRGPYLDRAGEQDLFVLVASLEDGHSFHVDATIPLPEDLYKFEDRYLVPMVNNLAGAVFNYKHPGLMSVLPTRMARALANNGALDPEDQKLWDEYKAMQIPRSEPAASSTVRNSPA